MVGGEKKNRHAGRKRILVVDPDVAAVYALERALHVVAPVTTCLTLSDALASSETERWVLAVIAVRLDRSSSGFDLLASLRASDPYGAARMTTTVMQPVDCNRATAAGAPLLCKPFARPEFDDLAWTARRSLAASSTGDDRVASVIACLVRERRLTGAETEVLTLATSGFSHAEILDARNICRDTLSRQVTCLLRKLGAPSLHDAVRRVTAEALAPC